MLMGWQRWFWFDPYYTGYERSFERLEKETRRLQDRKAQRAVNVKRFSTDLFMAAVTCMAAALVYASWVYRQPPEMYAVKDRAIHSSPIVIVPLLAMLLNKMNSWYLSLRERWDDGRIERLKKTRKDMLKSLKDCTHYDRIYELLKKYDPDEQEKGAIGQPNQSRVRQEDQISVVHHRRTASVCTSEEMLSATDCSRTPVAPSRSGRLPPRGPRGHPPRHQRSSSLVETAQKMIVPVFDHVANSIIGDNPEMLEELKKLKEEIAAKEKMISSLKLENTRMKEELQTLQREASNDDNEEPAQQGEKQEREVENKKIDE